MRYENFTRTFGLKTEDPSSKPGQMSIGDNPSDLASFLPSYWVSSLGDVPILGSNFEIIELDNNFIDFIESDGLFLNDDSFPTSSALSSSDEEYSDNDIEEIVSLRKPSELFPVLNEKIQSSISSLGGTVVPKLNWTVPKDSIWISANTLKCTSANEVYQLIKASDRIQSDLELLRTSSISSPQLFLRPFLELRHENEFRAFVINRELIAISQRNLDVFDPSILRNSYVLIDIISAFFERFFQKFSLNTYSFDVYVSTNISDVFLVDVNPLTENNCSGLFKFVELLDYFNDPNAEIVFRCIEKNEDTVIGLGERNFLPIDLLNSGSDMNNIDFNNLSQ